MTHIVQTSGRLAGTGSDDHLVGVAQSGKGQIHIYAQAGDDQIDLDFSESITGFSHGHHARGDRDGVEDRFSDTFNFVSLQHVGTGDIVVGRLEDFDSFDKIAIEGEIIDLNALPDNVRIVEFNGAHNDTQTNPQKWILISTNAGGHVFYSLEGARVDMTMDGSANSGHQEGHFIQPHQLPDFATLQDVKFVDLHNHVPIADASVDGKIINDHDATPADVREVIEGSASDDLIAAGLNADLVMAGEGDDVIWGGTGADTIYGGEGDDVIDGGIAAKAVVDVSLAGPAAQVFRLYQGIFDRDPDPEGFDFWVNLIETGQVTLKSIISGFVESVEYQTRFGDRSNEEFMSALYQFVLNRTPDASGFEFWMTVLNNGIMTRESMAKSFTQSREFKNASDDDFFLFVSSLQIENDILVGGAGNDTFVFTDRFGNDTVKDFEVSGVVDQIDLSGVSSIDDFDDLTENHLVEADQGAVIADAEGNSIQLIGVNKNDLDQNDFIF